MEHDQDQEPSQQERSESQEQPEVYQVEKDLDGWKFSRRGFLTAAAAVTAAAVTVGQAAAGTDQSGQAPAQEPAFSEDWVTLEMSTGAVAVVEPAQPHVQVWRFTNKSETTWCRGATLHFEHDGALQIPASVPLPDIAPGETEQVEVNVMAPAAAGTYQGRWYLKVQDKGVPVSLGSFVLQAGCIVESPHPYTSSIDQTWLVTNPDANAQSTMIHFSRLEVENPFDYVYIRDGAGNQIQAISGAYASGLWTNAVPGRDVQVQLFADGSIEHWGFCVDQVMTVQWIYLPMIYKQPTPTPIPSPTPCSCYGVCTCNPQCSCDGHCTCVPVHYWYPN